MAEIYALTDLDGSIRYIGKANKSTDRFKSHIRDARRRKTPVYCWINKLLNAGLEPRLQIIEICKSRSWQDAERFWIAHYKERGCKLLNVAEGGDEPHCPKEVRAANGRKVALARFARFNEVAHELGIPRIAIGQ